MLGIYIVQHTHEISEGQEDTKLIGVFDTKKAAQQMINRLLLQPGFKETPEGFHIEFYEINKGHWLEGYATYYYTLPATALSHEFALTVFKDTGIDQAAYELSLIYEAVTGITAAEARLKPPQLTAEQQANFTQIIGRRIKNEPLHRIFGWREFWGLRFRLSSATLEPRPDSETLIEAVIKHIPDRTPPLRVLDLGTGTGCLLLSVLNEYRNAQGIGIDISPLAVSTAAANSHSLKLAARAQFQLGDWEQENWVTKLLQSFSCRLRDPCALRTDDNQFDLIIANPPYIETTAALPSDVSNHDPHIALFAGTDGLAAYRQIIAGLPQLLAPNGFAVIELGAGQTAAVSTIAATHYLQVIDIYRDLGGHERCLVLQHSID